MRFLLLLLAPVLFVGCSLGKDEASLEPGNADRLVLQQADLPGFHADSSAGGRERWTARYRRTGAATEGPLAIESRAEISGTSDGARERLTERHGALDQSELDWQPIGEPGLGDESFASTLVRGAARSYEVVWREGNVTAHISVSGPEGRLPFADVLAIAEKQQRRISEEKN